MAMSRGWWAVLGLFVVGAQAAALAPAKIDKDSINMIARVYKLLGEPELAAKLLAYHKAGKVLFKPFKATEELGQLAYVRAGLTPRLNKLVINDMIYTIAQASLAKKFAERPFGGGFALATSYACTLDHEFVHMGQLMPNESPKYEDPAYRESEAFLVRNVERARLALMALRGAPASPQRTARLQQLLDRIAALRTEAGSKVVDIARLDADGKITPGQTFRFASLVALLDEMKAQAETAVKSAKKPPAIPAGPGWTLARSEVYYPNGDPATRENPNNHRLVLTASSAVATFSAGDKRANLTVTWKGVPNQIVAGQPIALGFAMMDSGCDAGFNPDSVFLGVAVTLFGQKDEGAPYERLQGHPRTLYAFNGKQLQEAVKLGGVAGDYKVLTLQFEAVDCIDRAGINLTYTRTP